MSSKCCWDHAQHPGWCRGPNSRIYVCKTAAAMEPSSASKSLFISCFWMLLEGVDASRRPRTQDMVRGVVSSSRDKPQVFPHSISRPLLFFGGHPFAVQGLLLPWGFPECRGFQDTELPVLQPFQPAPGSLHSILGPSPVGLPTAPLSSSLSAVRVLPLSHRNVTSVRYSACVPLAANLI